MIGTEKLDHLISTILMSAHIAGERPLSALIVARVESGKTELLQRFARNPGILLLDDSTAFGITRRILKDQKQGLQINHILLPDLIIPLSRNRDTVATLIAFLSCLIEEGVTSLETYATTVQLKIPLRAGLVAAIAKEEFVSNRRSWARVGFMSRMLPLSFSYSAATVVRIKEFIAKRAYHQDSSITLAFPEVSLPIDLPAIHANTLMLLSSEVSKRQDEATRIYGFRLQRQLQTFAMAHALLDGRDIVADSDVDATASLSSFWDLSYSQL